MAGSGATRLVATVLRCRPGSAEPIPGIAVALSLPQAISWEAGHGRTC